MFTIWNDFLYQPIFNFLIWIYNNWTNENFGWAVVYLTLILRTTLLPFTFISEKNRAKNANLYEEIKTLSKSYQKDPILRNEEIRRTLKKRKVTPWTKIVVLGIQLLVLLLLYQVFLRGITGEKILKILYPSVDFPGAINTIFYGFDLGMTHDYVWAGAVALFMVAEIYLQFRKRKGGLNKGDLAYFILFPLAVFLALWWLPMVKSLFILTSIVFSAIVGAIIRSFFRQKPMPKAAKSS